MVLVYLHSSDMKERYGKVLECTVKKGAHGWLHYCRCGNVLLWGGL